MDNKIIEILKLNLAQGKIISIVGADGKSTLVRKLAFFYSDKKVLVSTTTKMKISEVEEFNFIKKENLLHKDFKTNKTGIFTTYKELNQDKTKIIGLNNKYFDLIKEKFDIIILECDGSKEKPLKGNRDFEPVIPSSTNYTIGVISFREIGKKPSSKNIYNLELFLKTTGLNENEIITLEILYKFIVHEKGLFKDSKGMKLLYFSHENSFGFEDNFNEFVEKYYLEDIYILR